MHSDHTFLGPGIITTGAHVGVLRTLPSVLMFCPKADAADAVADPPVIGPMAPWSGGAPAVNCGAPAAVGGAPAVVCGAPAWITFSSFLICSFISLISTLVHSSASSIGGLHLPTSSTFGVVGR